VVCIVVCIVVLTVRGERCLRFGEVHDGGGGVDVCVVDGSGVQMREESSINCIKLQVDV